jgi:tagatose 6-phosphate kinase
MSGTIASGGPPDLYHTCTQIAGAAGLLTILDASGEPLRKSLAASPGLVKPNRVELEATVGRELRQERALLEAMLELHKLGAQRVVITSGSAPTLATDGKKMWRVTSPRITAVNPIGSGDSFTAGVTWKLVQGCTLGEACRWGAAAGAANALTLMAGEVDRGEVESLVKQVTVEEV